MHTFNVDDRVIYTGSKFAGELGSKVGYVIKKVAKQEGAYVVDFDGEGYIMPVSKLAPYRPSGKDNDAPEAHQRRFRKRDSDD